MNDKALGEKHIEIIDIFNEDATMNSFGLHYQGKTVLSYVQKSKKLETSVLWQSRGLP
jgi:valyl-tRNA synthetase